MARGEVRRNTGKIKNEGCGVDGHVKDAGCEREPGLLKAPEWPHSAAHPLIKTAIGGNGGGEFPDHERSRDAPEDRDKKEKKEGPLVARVPDDIFEPVRPAGDHEVGRRDEWKQPQFAGQSSQSQGAPKAMVTEQIYAKETSG